MYSVHFWKNEYWYLESSLNSIIFNSFEEARMFVENKYLNRINNSIFT